MKICHIAYLLMYVQINKLSTFFFWLALPIIFTFLLAQQTGVVDSSTIPLLSVMDESREVIINLEQGFTSYPEDNKKTSGMMVMFTLIFMLSSAASLIWERDQGTLRRLKVMSVSNTNIIMGKLLGAYIMGIAQLLVLAISNILMFDLIATVNLFSLLMVILIFGFSAVSLGMLIASMARTQEQASALTLIVVFCISALGGAWWPLAVVPEYMQSIATALPTYWALTGFYQTMHVGVNTQQIIQPLLMLLGFGVLFLVIGLYRFKL